MNTNYSYELFSRIVSSIEFAQKNNISCGTYDQLADILNFQGFTNSRGKYFSGSSLQKYLHRIRHPKGYSRVLTELMIELKDMFLEEEKTSITSIWNLLPVDEDNEPTKSDIALEKYTNAIIASNTNHFYGESSYV